MQIRAPHGLCKARWRTDRAVVRPLRYVPVSPAIAGVFLDSAGVGDRGKSRAPRPVVYGALRAGTGKYLPRCCNGPGQSVATYES